MSIQDLLNSVPPSIRDAFLASFADIKSQAQVSVIQAALNEGRIEDALRALHLDDEFFAPLDDALRAAYIEGGRDALAGLPALADPFRQAALLSVLVSATQERSNGLGNTRET